MNLITVLIFTVVANALSDLAVSEDSPRQWAFLIGGGLSGMSGSDLVSRVDRDPSLSGDEKETTISMYGRDKAFTVFSAKPTVVKSLLKHDHFELGWARVLDGESRTRATDRDQLRETAGDIVGVKGQMPVGVLSIKSKPRANNHQSSIVTAETIDSSVFE